MTEWMNSAFYPAGWLRVLVASLGLLCGTGQNAPKATPEVRTAVAENPPSKSPDRASSDGFTNPHNNPLVGKSAPDLKGDFALNGQPILLSDLKGKVVLLNYWAAWCGPCFTSFPDLNKLHQEFGDDGLVVIGVTTYWKIYDFDQQKGQLKPAKHVQHVKDEETGKLKVIGGPSETQEQGMLSSFAQHHTLNYLLMALTKEDWDKATTEYAFHGIPTFFLIDRIGQVRMVRMGCQEENFRALRAMIRELLEEKK